MMLGALLALAFGAVAGIYLAVRHFRHKRLPAVVALLHGLGGATGFTLVLITVVLNPDFRPIRDVLYLLIATVALGVVNLLFHIRKVRHRTSLILLHGLTAVTSAGMLIRAILVFAPAPPDVADTAQPPATSATAAASASSAPPEAASATATASASASGTPPAPAGDEFVVDDSVASTLKSPIQFETNSAIVSESSSSAIAEIATTLKQHSEITLVQVQGHADERGEDSRNVALTRARAAAVVNALVASGVARERLHSAGYGSRCPEDEACQAGNAPDTCHSSESWQRDRRVVFKVLMVGKAPFRGEVVCARGAPLIPPEDRRFHSSK